MGRIMGKQDAEHIAGLNDNFSLEWMVDTW